MTDDARTLLNRAYTSFSVILVDTHSVTIGSREAQKSFFENATRFLQIMLNPFSNKVNHGATLAELLIALAILGVISTFTIPKILYSQTQQRKMAVFKETIASIQNILISGSKLGELDRANNGTYLMEHLNAIKICPTDSSTEGCWDPGIQGALFDEYIEPGVTLASGATISGFNDSNINVNGLHLDWNGTQGPNVIGDDQILLLLCIGPAMCTFDIAGSGPRGPGSVGPFDLDAYYSDPSTSYDNRVLFEKIFE